MSRTVIVTVDAIETITKTAEVVVRADRRMRQARCCDQADRGGVRGGGGGVAVAVVVVVEAQEITGD